MMACSTRRSCRPAKPSQHRRRGRRGHRRRADRGGHGCPPHRCGHLFNHEYLRGLGASEVFDYHAADWVEQVLAVVPERRRPALRLRRWSDHGPGSGCRARRRPGDLGDPPIRSSPARAGHHGRIVRRPAEAGSDWKHSPAWSTPASYARRSKRSCRWARFARRWAGSRADTRAARSCSRSGNSANGSAPPCRSTPV